MTVTELTYSQRHQALMRLRAYLQDNRIPTTLEGETYVSAYLRSNSDIKASIRKLTLRTNWIDESGDVYSLLRPKILDV